MTSNFLPLWRLYCLAFLDWKIISWLFLLGDSLYDLTYFWVMTFAVQFLLAYISVSSYALIWSLNILGFFSLLMIFIFSGYVDTGSPTVAAGRSWKSTEMEIQSLLEKLLDINDAMSRCAASAAPTTSVTQKLARHRDILHEFTQVYVMLIWFFTLVMNY